MKSKQLFTENVNKQNSTNSYCHAAVLKSTPTAAAAIFTQKSKQTADFFEEKVNKPGKSTLAALKTGH